MADEPGGECLRCGGPLSWVDVAWRCGEGHTYCSDCKEELGATCPNDSDELRAERRTRPAGR
jgi:hypothetical protein